MTLRLYLLGEPRIELNGQPFTARSSKKANALLFYLAVEGRAQARETLAELLWGDTASDPNRSLRVDLTYLNRHFAPYLITMSHALAFNAESDATVDVQQFVALAQATPATPQQWAEAAALYRGDFLHNFAFPHSTPDFETWVLHWRARLRGQVIDLLNHLIQHQFTAGDPRAALPTVQRLLQLEPWVEEYHRTAMRIYALDGQTAQALAQYQHCVQLLHAEFGQAPAEETVALAREIEQGGRNFAPARPTFGTATGNTPAPFQAPPPPRYFVGRQALLARLGEQLTARTAHNVHALVGMGGIGKSALAIYLAHHLARHFPDGVLWASPSTSELMVILESWAHALGYDLSRLTDLNSRAAALRSILAQKQVLIILDSVVEADDLAQIFPGTSSSAILITTRNLGVALALDAQEEFVSELTPDEGYELLARIVGAERCAAERAAAATLCKLVQNLPLALEILGKRLRYPAHQSLAETSRHLAAMKSRLSWLHQIAPAKVEVRASIMVSWEALTPPLQATLAAMGIFGGLPFTLEALAHVRDSDKYTTGDHVAALLHRSLVVERDATHYQQHALLAEFAVEQLTEPDMVAQRHADFFARFAHVHQNDFAMLEEEWEHLRNALNYLHERTQHDAHLALGRTLTPIWFSRGYFADARQGYSRIISAYEHNAWALCHWARACLEQADYAEAETHLQRCLARCVETADPRVEAEARLALGRVAVERADFDAARTHLQACRTLKAALQDHAGVAQTLYLEADIPYYAGDYEEARRLGQEALEMQRASGDELGCVQSLGLLADIAIKRRRFDLAAKYCADALTLCDHIHDRCERAIIHYIWCEVLRLQSPPDLAAARRHIQQSMELLQRMGDRQMQARALLRLSAVEFDAGEIAAAQRAVEASSALNRTLDNAWSLVYDLHHLGTICAAAQETAAAQRHWQEALATAARFPHHPLAAVLAQLLDGSPSA